MQSMSASKLNVKQLREKYEEIKQNNRACSARLSQASSRDRQTHGSQKHYDNVQKSQELLCSPCYNKKIFEQQEQMKKQQQQLEKNFYRSELELNMKQEHTKISLYEMEQKRKKEIELQNLNLSKQYHLLKQEQQKKLKAEELEFEKTINKKNYELELKEKYEKTQKKVSFGQELKVQIEEKKRLTQQDFRENNGIIDDPYWRHQSQGEKEVQQRKNFQLSYVNNNWINYEKERLKQKGQNESIKKQEQEDRMKNLKEYHIQLQTEKQKKMLLQKELVNDISEQIRRKRERESQERMLNQQLQRQRDEQDLNKQRQRELREIDNKKNINQQMIEGLQHQLSYKKSTAKKEKEDSYNNTLLLSSVLKQKIPCSNCKRCQDRQLLSVL